MNEPKFSKFMVATIKRTAQNVAPMVAKKNKLKAKIDALQAEYDSICTQQEQFEASIKTMTGGYTTEDLVDKVVAKKTNEDGTVIMSTKYVLKYPDTIIPPTEDTGNVEDTENTNNAEDTESIENTENTDTSVNNEENQLPFDY